MRSVKSFSLKTLGHIYFLMNSLKIKTFLNLNLISKFLYNSKAPHYTPYNQYKFKL